MRNVELDIALGMTELELIMKLQTSKDLHKYVIHCRRSRAEVFQRLNTRKEFVEHLVWAAGWRNTNVHRRCCTPSMQLRERATSHFCIIDTIYLIVCVLHSFYHLNLQIICHNSQIILHSTLWISRYIPTHYLPLILIITCRTGYHYPPFTHEETKTQRG